MCETYANGDGSTNSAMRRDLCAHSLAFSSSSSLSCAEYTTAISPLLLQSATSTASPLYPLPPLVTRLSSVADCPGATPDPGSGALSDQKDEYLVSKPEFVALAAHFRRPASSVQLMFSTDPSTGNNNAFEQLRLPASTAILCRIPCDDTSFGGSSQHEALAVSISDCASPPRTAYHQWFRQSLPRTLPLALSVTKLIPYLVPKCSSFLLLLLQ